MKEYRVNLLKTATSATAITVFASNREEAEAHALAVAEAGGVEFTGDPACEYAIDECDDIDECEDD